MKKILLMVTVAVMAVSCSKTQETNYVDLGLSVKWAKCNLGAGSVGEYGSYFAWGELKPSENYSFENYKFAKVIYPDEEVFFTKYVPQSQAGDYGFEGFYDDKSVLDFDDDAAHVGLGGKWRLPTAAEFQELKDNCQWQWTEIEGVKGYKVTGTKAGYTDRWIFLPAAGYCVYNLVQNAGSFGLYWSSSLNTDAPDGAYGLGFDSKGESMGNDTRCLGLSVRPVSE